MGGRSAFTELAFAERLGLEAKNGWRGFCKTEPGWRPVPLLLGRPPVSAVAAPGTTLVAISIEGLAIPMESFWMTARSR